MFRRDDKIEMTPGRSRILNLNDERFAGGCVFDPERGSDALASGSDEKIGPGRHQRIAAGAELPATPEAQIGCNGPPEGPQGYALIYGRQPQRLGQAETLA